MTTATTNPTTTTFMTTPVGMGTAIPMATDMAILMVIRIMGTAMGRRGMMLPLPLGWG